MEILNFFAVVLIFASLSKAQQYENGENEYDSRYTIENFKAAIQDDTEVITRPCPVYDTNCIRKFFASHAKCKIAYGPTPDPLYRPQVNLYYPAFNISASQIGLTFTGLSRGQIAEFYVEEKTQQVVLQIRVQGLTLQSTYDVYRFHRNGKEDAVTYSQSNAIYPQISLTTIFRLQDHLDLAKSETTMEVEAPPVPVLNPSAGVHPDPTVAPMFAAFQASPQIIFPEAGLTVGVHLAGYFIQYSICDYGLIPY